MRKLPIRIIAERLQQACWVVVFAASCTTPLPTDHPDYFPPVAFGDQETYLKTLSPTRQVKYFLLKLKTRPPTIGLAWALAEGGAPVFAEIIAALRSQPDDMEVEGLSLALKLMAQKGLSRESCDVAIADARLAISRTKWFSQNAERHASGIATFCR